MFFDTNAYSEVFITRISSKIAIGKKALNLTVTLGFLKPHAGANLSEDTRKCPYPSKQTNRIIFLSICKVVMRSY